MARALSSESIVSFQFHAFPQYESLIQPTAETAPCFIILEPPNSREHRTPHRRDFLLFHLSQQLVAAPGSSSTIVTTMTMSINEERLISWGKYHSDGMTQAKIAPPIQSTNRTMPVRSEVLAGASRALDRKVALMT